MSHHAHLFTADYTDGSVTLAGQTFPAGYFVTDFLNAYPELHFNDKAGLQALWLTMELSSGRVDDDTFREAKPDVIALFQTICELTPFSLLCDCSKESGYLDEMFNPDEISDLRAVISTPGSEGVPLHENKEVFTLERLDEIDYMREELEALLPFYSELEQDMQKGYACIAGACTEIAKHKYPTLQDLTAAAKHSELGEYCPASRRYYAFSEAADDGLSISHRMVFTRYLSFLITDFYEGIKYGHYQKRCGNCGRWFLVADGFHRIYCDGIDPNDTKHRSCRKVAASKKRRENRDVHPVRKLYQIRLSTVRKHKERQKLTEDEFARAARYTEDRRDRAIADTEYANSAYRPDMELQAIYAAIGKEYKTTAKGGSS